MLSLHNPSATVFTSSGRAILDKIALSATVEEQINGPLTLNVVLPLNPGVSIALSDIIAAPVPWAASRQGFRVYKITKTTGQTLNIECRHVFYDLATNLVEDTNIINKSASQALKQVLDHLVAPHPFTTNPPTADAPIVSTRYVRKTGVEAILGDEGIIAKWGGQLYRDNFYIDIRPRLGKNTQAVISDATNLLTLSAAQDFSTVLTRVMPIGFDGLMLPEKYVDAPQIGAFFKPLIGVLRLEDVKAAKDEANPAPGELPLAQALETLRSKARSALEEQLQWATLAYEVKADPAFQTIATRENLQIGDQLRIRSRLYDEYLTGTVYGYQYDAIAQTYLDLQISNLSSFTPGPTLAGRIETVSTQIGQAKDLAIQAMASADGLNTVYHGPARPSKARVGDTWFEDDGSGKINIWAYQQDTNGTTQWVQIAGDITSAQIQTQIENLTSEITQATQAASAAAQAADQAAQTVGEKTGLIDQAKQAADDALEKAQTASNGLEALQTRITDPQNGLESRITQLAEDINLRVSKDGIISQINLSPETILIEGKRVHISGQTTIDNGIITTAMIADATITSAKIGSLDAGKITTGTLAAARIGAGTITSDKLTIAAGFIKTAMIADAAITSAKIGSLDAGKITTGTLNAARIGAGSITADKLAANAIQVGLAGWNNSIRISPYMIEWYDGTSLAGQLSSGGMTFYWGTRLIGSMGTTFKQDNSSVRGISFMLSNTGDFVTWAYQRSATDTAYQSYLTLDPKGAYTGYAGIHLGTGLYTNNHALYTSGRRPLYIADTSLSGPGTIASLYSSASGSKVCFTSNHLYVVTGGTYFSLTALQQRVTDCIRSINTILSYLNQGWIHNITNNGGQISWTRHSGTGLSSISYSLA